MQQSDKQAAPEWVSRPERSNTLAIRFIVWVALSLGRTVARLFLYPICLYFLLSAGEARSASKKYLRKVLGREPRMADGFRHIHTFASTILDRVFLLNGRFDKFKVSVHLDAAAQALFASKQGCILMGAHLGSFEIARAYADEVDGPPASVVMYEENARKLNAVLHAINPNLAQQVIGLGKIDSMLKVKQALQARRVHRHPGGQRAGAGRRQRELRFSGRAGEIPNRADAHRHPAEESGDADGRGVSRRQPLRSVLRRSGRYGHAGMHCRAKRCSSRRCSVMCPASSGIAATHLTIGSTSTISGNDETHPVR